MFSKKELYIAFLQASSVRYFSNALSNISAIEISHDVLSKWLKTAQLRPAEVLHESKNYIDIQEPYLLRIDHTVIDKQYSEKIDIVRYLYSGNGHDVIKGLAVTNLVWNGLEKNIRV